MNATNHVKLREFWKTWKFLLTFARSADQQAGTELVGCGKKIRAFLRCRETVAVLQRARTPAVGLQGGHITGWVGWGVKAVPAGGQGAGSSNVFFRCW